MVSYDLMCKLNNVDLDFFLLVCNTHTFSDYLPSKKQIRLLNIDSLINYLNRSHNYYINNRINDIKSKLTNLGQLCKSEHFHIINSFFEEYREEVIKHFQYEERVVFPYIVELVNGNTKDIFHIIQYEENHSNIDDKLSDLKNILIKYLPEEYDSKEREDLLTEIFLFEEDLTKHTIIEDKILIPFVTEIEKTYEK